MTTNTTYEVRVSNRGLIARHIPGTTGLTQERAEATAALIKSEYKDYPHITVEVVPESSTTPDISTSLS